MLCCKRDIPHSFRTKLHRPDKVLHTVQSAVLNDLQASWALGSSDDLHDISQCISRYPLIIEDCIEEWAEMVDGIEVPVDFSQPNPNGMEFDNLYLVISAHSCSNIHIS